MEEEVTLLVEMVDGIDVQQRPLGFLHCQRSHVTVHREVDIVDAGGGRTAAITVTCEHETDGVGAGGNREGGTRPILGRRNRLHDIVVDIKSKIIGTEPAATRRIFAIIGDGIVGGGRNRQTQGAAATRTQVTF